MACDAIKLVFNTKGTPAKLNENLLLSTGFVCLSLKLVSLTYLVNNELEMKYHYFFY